MPSRPRLLPKVSSAESKPWLEFQELRRHEDLLARDSRARHRASDTLLVAVGGGRVDVPIADLERLLDYLLCVVWRNLEDTEAELWDLGAVVEGDVRNSAHALLACSRASEGYAATVRVSTTPPRCRARLA